MKAAYLYLTRIRVLGKKVLIQNLTLLIIYKSIPDKPLQYPKEEKLRPIVSVAAPDRNCHNQINILKTFFF